MLSSADSTYLNADLMRLHEGSVSSDPDDDDEEDEEGEQTEEEEEEEDSHSVPPGIANAAKNADQARAPAHTACTTPGHTRSNPLVPTLWLSHRCVTTPCAPSRARRMVRRCVPATSAEI